MKYGDVFVDSIKEIDELGVCGFDFGSIPVFDDIGISGRLLNLFVFAASVQVVNMDQIKADELGCLDSGLL
jgi:hypothetical protein